MLMARICVQRSLGRLIARRRGEASSSPPCSRVVMHEPSFPNDEYENTVLGAMNCGPYRKDTICSHIVPVSYAPACSSFAWSCSPPALAHQRLPTPVLVLPGKLFLLQVHQQSYQRQQVHPIPHPNLSLPTWFYREWGDPMTWFSISRDACCSAIFIMELLAV